MADTTSENEDTGPPAVTAAVVPLKHLRNHIGAITRRVHDTGETVVISNYGRPLVAIVPIPQSTDTPEATRPDDAPAPPIRLRRPDPDDDPPPPIAAAA